MQLTLYRQTTNELYTEGQLAVNDKRQTQTVEATECMLPTGTYKVKLSKVKKGRKQIVIFQNSPNPPNHYKPQSTGWIIGVSHSWIGSKREHCICIGQQVIPGALFKGTEPYERLYDRIEKCLQRGESITLDISDSHCESNRPIKHWL